MTHAWHISCDNRAPVACLPPHVQDDVTRVQGSPPRRYRHCSKVGRPVKGRSSPSPSWLCGAQPMGCSSLQVSWPNGLRLNAPAACHPHLLQRCDSASTRCCCRSCGPTLAGRTTVARRARLLTRQEDRASRKRRRVVGSMEPRPLSLQVDQARRQRGRRARPEARAKRLARHIVRHAPDDGRAGSESRSPHAHCHRQKLV